MDTCISFFFLSFFFSISLVYHRRTIDPPHLCLAFGQVGGPVVRKPNSKMKRFQGDGGGGAEAGGG